MIIGSIKSITLEDQCSLERDRNLVLRLSFFPGHGDSPPKKPLRTMSGSVVLLQPGSLLMSVA